MPVIVWSLGGGPVINRGSWHIVLGAAAPQIVSAFTNFAFASPPNKVASNEVESCFTSECGRHRRTHLTAASRKIRSRQEKEKNVGTKRATLRKPNAPGHRLATKTSSPLSCWPNILLLGMLQNHGFSRSSAFTLRGSKSLRADHVALAVSVGLLPLWHPSFQWPRSWKCTKKHNLIKDVQAVLKNRAAADGKKKYLKYTSFLCFWVGLGWVMVNKDCLKG